MTANRTPPYCDPRFNLTDKQIDAIAVGWRRLIDDNGLELLASEATVVNDELRLAGTLDRLARTTRPLTFGDVVIPADVVIVLDIKTSKLNPDDDGTPGYWDGFPMQLAAYAGSCRYDPDTDERTNWPFEIEQQYAVIAHLDIPRLDGDDGQAVWQLIYADLDVAQQGIAALHAAEAYAKAPKFKMTDRQTKIPAATVNRRERLMARYADLDDQAKVMFSMLGITKGSTDDEVQAALDQVDPFAQVAPTPEPRRTPQPAETPPEPPSDPVLSDLDRRRRDTAQLIADTVGDDRAVRRLILHTVTPDPDTALITELECRQLAAVCAAFGDTIGLKYSDTGQPALVGDTAAIVATVQPNTKRKREAK